MPTADESPRPRVRLLSERPSVSRLTPTPDATSTSPAQASDESSAPSPSLPDPSLRTADPSLRLSRADFLQQMTATLMAIAAVLASRLLSMLALCGSFALSYQAIQTQSLTSLMVATSFSILVVLPLTWLAWQKG